MHGPKINRTLELIFVGPQLNSPNPSYGGGAGGVVSACLRMIKWFESEQFDYVFVPYSVRQKSPVWWLNLPIRLVGDFIRFKAHINNTSNARLIHLFVDGGPSVFRSLLFIWYAKSRGLLTICDVRGGVLDEYATKKKGVRLHWDWLISNSYCVLVQKPSTVAILKKQYGDKVRYHPNWIDDTLYFSFERDILVKRTIDVVFVGYCFRDKGVFDAVLGCKEASANGLSIRLTLIGEQDPEFARFCDELPYQSGFELRCYGKLSRSDVLKHLCNMDVFLFASYHSGEGHPNVINEALLSQLLIVTTKAGSIGELLDEKTAVFIQMRDPNSIVRALIKIDKERLEMNKKAKFARLSMLKKLASSKVLGDLLSIYDQSYLDRT